MILWFLCRQFGPHEACQKQRGCHHMDSELMLNHPLCPLGLTNTWTMQLQHLLLLYRVQVASEACLNPSKVLQVPKHCVLPMPSREKQVHSFFLATKTQTVERVVLQSLLLNVNHLTMNLCNMAS